VRGPLGLGVPGGGRQASIGAAGLAAPNTFLEGSLGYCLFGPCRCSVGGVFLYGCADDFGFVGVNKALCLIWRYLVGFALAVANADGIGDLDVDGCGAFFGSHDFAFLNF